MNQSDNQLKEIIKFINFNLHPHASFYNIIDGIVYSGDIKKTVKEAMNLLKLEYSLIDYPSKGDFEIFYKKFSELLSQGNIIYIDCHNLKLDPIFFDQISQIRNNNKFNIRSGTIDLSEVKIHPNSKIFLLFNQNDSMKPINDTVDLTDHLLDLRKIN